MPRCAGAVEQFGAVEVCEFRKGWFEDTLPGFPDPVDVALLDVDLLSSTRTCIAALYPRLCADGVLFSQDGHLKAVADLLADPGYWASLGVEPPAIEGLGRDKLLRMGPSVVRDAP